MPQAEFRVQDRSLPYALVDDQVRAIAEQLMADIARDTPHDTGHLAAGWETVKVREAHYYVRNSVPYARFVEYGTKNVHARPVAGRTLASYRSRWGRR